MRRVMRLRHVLPLLGFAIPTVIVGYGVVIPGTCVAGVNELSVGFATTIIGASIAYLVGVRLALRERLDES
jgi:ABC-type Fe3+ transport system permease subunit